MLASIVYMPSCVKGEAPSSAVPQVCFDVYRLDLPNEQLWRGPQALPLTAKALRVLGLPVAGISESTGGGWTSN